ncbi:MAG: NAD(P)/FAD-dependent oxidoreductase [Bacteroidota bacterium]
MQYDCIIIGGGASGLIAAAKLLKRHRRVLILEARERLGGRIHTVKHNFSVPVDLGAEFIHGDLPVTLKLMQEHGLEKQAVTGDNWRSHDHKLEQDQFAIEHHEVLESGLKGLFEDVTVKDFVGNIGADGKYDEMKRSIVSFVQGYDTADIAKASTFALRDEWLGMKEENQYRPVNGYVHLVEALVKDVLHLGGEIITSTTVAKISYGEGKAEVYTINGDILQTAKVLVSVPAGVLQLDPGQAGHIEFEPRPEAHLAAYKRLGYGHVVKVIFEFKEAFWRKGNDHRPVINTLGMLFSDETFPTWWSNPESPAHLLIGWLGGPDAKKFSNSSNDDIIAEALQSLAAIFGEDAGVLKSMLVACDVGNWSAEPFTLGAYNYRTVNDKSIISTLKQPVKDTVFFCGEAVYDGDASGTVEAALVSGIEAAAKILGTLEPIREVH